MTSLEEVSYVKGVYQAFRKQQREYSELIERLLELEGQIVLAEKQLKIARDHLCMVIEKTPGAVPPNWEKTLRSVRFVGMRLADACLTILKEHGQVTTQELITELNGGQYRWHSNSPARELNAALLRQPNVQRNEDTWLYKGDRTALPEGRNPC